MKKSLFLAVFPCLLATVQAQNLVLNPSFEEKSLCPRIISGDTGGIHYAKYWHSPGKSPDYFNACGVQGDITGGADVPKNTLGYQYAHTGDAYAGCILTDSSSVAAFGFFYNYREYIEGTLSMSLQKDSLYRVGFYVSRADEEKYYARAVDRIGAYLHKQYIPPKIYNNPTPFIINAKPQVENLRGRILYDTMGWTHICGFYKATGGEAYITIGNFYDEEHTQFVHLVTGTTRKISYYYIDDVSVEKIPQHLSPFRFTDNSIICKSDSVSTYGVPPSLSQVLWSTGDSAHQVGIKGAGQYWVRAMEDGCLFSDTFNIQYVPPPVFGFPSDSAQWCSTALPLALKTTDCCAKILWSTGDTTQTTSIAQPGWVWVQEDNACGSLRDSIYLSIVHPPHLDLGKDTALCDTSQFLRTLSAPPGMDAYLWSTGHALPSLQVTQPGTYSIEIQNTCGTYRDTVRVRDLRDDLLRLPGDTTLCLTKPLPLQVEPAFDTYAWDTGHSTQRIEADDYGMYRVTVTNACGTQSGSVSVSVSNHPEVILPTLLSIHLGDSVQLSPSVNHDKPVRYNWSPSAGLGCADCAEPFARPFLSSVFTVTATDSLGCADAATVRVNVLYAERFYLPNVFSPNGDGENDHLVAHFGNEVVEVLSARLYDRWGELVVERKGAPGLGSFEVWDGTHRGRFAVPGVYAVVMDIRLLDGTVAQVAGDVTVVR